MRRAQGKSWERTRSEMVNYPLDTSNTPCADRPLVTFALFAYNQEKYIREAIEGAFAQTYQPLEIILSDDCSKDRTFEIMEEMAQEYRGPHQIVLNRNPSNLGIGGHVSRVMQLCSGEFVVVAAGDDISLPERTESLVEVWLGSGRKAKLVHSAARCIDADSRDLRSERKGEIALEDPTVARYVFFRPKVLGAAHGWELDVFREFGSLISGVLYEDQVFTLRALLLGRVVYVAKPLLRYRMATGVMHTAYASAASNRAGGMPTGHLKGRYRTVVQMCRDLSQAGGHEAPLAHLKRERTERLMSYWFAQGGRLSIARLRLFHSRCSSRWIIRQFLRYRMSWLFGGLRSARDIFLLRR